MHSNIDPHARGVEVSWSFGRHDATSVRIPRSVLRELITDHGFIDCVSDVTPTQALRAATRVVKGRTSEIVIQPIRSPYPDSPTVCGVYYVVPAGGESGDDVLLGARLRVESGAIRCRPPEGHTEYPNDQARVVAESIETHANNMMTSVYNTELSAALSSIGYNQVRWINRRRNSGGVYLLLRSVETDRFVQMIRAISEYTQRQHPQSPSRQFFSEVIEVFPRPLSDEMYAQAASRHFEEKLETLATKLDAKRSSPRFRSMVEAGAAEVDSLMSEASQYEELLVAYGSRIRDALAAMRTDLEHMLVSGDVDSPFAFLDTASAAE